MFITDLLLRIHLLFFSLENVQSVCHVISKPSKNDMNSLLIE